MQIDAPKMHNYFGATIFFKPSLRWLKYLFPLASLLIHMLFIYERKITRKNEALTGIKQIQEKKELEWFN